MRKNIKYKYVYMIFLPWILLNPIDNSNLFYIKGICVTKFNSNSPIFKERIPMGSKEISLEEQNKSNIFLVSENNDTIRSMQNVTFAYNIRYSLYFTYAKYKLQVSNINKYICNTPRDSLFIEIAVNVSANDSNYEVFGDRISSGLCGSDIMEFIDRNYNDSSSIYEPVGSRKYQNVIMFINKI